MMKATNQGSRAVLIIGAGIAGMQAALDLAAMDYEVYLLDRSPSIGGNMARLDKTFPTNDCSTCMISPRMVAASRHPNIHIMTHSECTGLAGEPGAFTAQVRVHPRYVDPQTCIGCGLCVEKCPKKAPNEYNAGMDTRKAIHFLYPQAIPLVPVIDTENCLYFQKGKCRICEKLCPTKAVRLQDQIQQLELSLGAVILAAGFELGLVPQAGEYGHGRYPNVVANLEFERMLSAAGPFGGQPKRPSDGKKPQNIAWIQCVASRDSARKRNFCSSVCCMAAVKQAILTREHDPESRATIFYMDIRAHGKDFDRYVLRAKDQYGVRFIRSMLSQVMQNPENGNLIIEYYDRNTLEHRQEEFDLVVLSAGFKPNKSIGPLIRTLGLQQNRYGFIEPDLEDPTHTSKPGVYVCGVLDGPKDIPESVSSASAAAASVAALLGGHSDADVPTQSERPKMRDMTGEAPRIGVFVCHCGKNIAGVVDVESVRRYAQTLPHVVAVEDFMFTCSSQTQQRMQELIGEHRLNRVVVAACSPRTHEPLFQETLQRAGLNKHFFEMANIRDQCSWVHADDAHAATDKAKDLVRAAVARAALLEPFDDVATEVVPSALVIGGGLAGMTAALNLADQGLTVHLVEKEEQLGGMARRIHHTLEGGSPRRMAERLALRVKSHRNIALRTAATVQAISGNAGRFKALVQQNGASFDIECGAVILAAGGSPYRPASSDYGYGEHPKVVTQLELEERIMSGKGALPQTTVMIQCIGSRNDDFPLCSRVCCAAAVKNSILLLEKNPAASVYILYRDVRTFGFKEEYYRKARDRGVIFIKFEPESPPEVLFNGDEVRVDVFDPASQMNLEIGPDLLVLSAGIRPQPEVDQLGKILKLPFMQEGFFMEAHPKLSPLDFSRPGVFVCGLAHSPRFIEESITQALGAAARASGLLWKKQVYSSGIVAEVKRELCSACLVCVYTCPYQVPYIDKERVSVIDPEGCQGCGICVSECPAKAITFKHYNDDQILAQIEGAINV
ncbi:CoB--CoM heterodisulfide reductase iron-sulfur subunit A family protein [Desulfoferrobacter suflitae]|uniref:CoB--CoM heterodisulfide reductase iron-sulfur subunit A family protein n=1 Tax=Desulfoferrobacter suflitae TaxID=2865782 RepID=UPI0021640AAB|nr:CoB--CoM heterodisulfide reductase iron-sulfur subunit A family protein [Desulfoferrobacter suflitae]MCK8604256.1 CoB--CoM heterodisulfide reductase iron-sulfur subunit A family protein [Desulfoferrobacter suflitae]